MNILVVEDDPRIASVVRQALTEEGHYVEVLRDGQDAEHHILTMTYNVTLLDLMLPVRDGFSILKRVRDARCTMPILVLSARDAMGDVVRALDLGADDYVTKPFNLEMLLARVRSVSRRGPVTEPAQTAAAGLVLIPSRRELMRDGETIAALTPREFALLDLLMRRENKVVTREQLIEMGWGLGAEVMQNSLEFHIHSLRSKIDVDGAASLIHTVRAVGYRFGA